MVAKKTKKKNAEYTLIKKRSKRWAVRGKDGKYINGEEKVKILLKEKKIKINQPKKKDPPAENSSEKDTKKESE